MRAPCLLAVLLLVAGCTSAPTPAPSSSAPPSSTEAPATVLVAVLSGDITETGPAYAYKGAYCGRVAHSIHLDEAARVLGFTQQSPDVPLAADILIVDRVHVALMQGPGDCGSDGAVRGFVHAGNITVGAYGHAQAAPLQADGAALRFREQDMAAGGHASWPYGATHVWAPTATEARNGTYAYEGNLTLRYLGAWPAANIHHMASCAEIAGGC